MTDGSDTALPYGVFAPRGGARRRLGVRVGEHVLDLGASFHELGHSLAETLSAESLNPFMALGAGAWADVRGELVRRVGAGADRDASARHLHPLSGVDLHLPFDVADYVDFYASEAHATNLGRMFRPDGEPLLPNWKHLPVGYHGRAGTVVVSGTPIVRPSGQRKAPDEATPSFGPAQRLDFEAELGFVVGVPSRLGEPVPQERFAEHVFGVCLVNDWSARDIQAWEYVPLGPFLGKSFATSVSPWVVPLAALEAARVPPPGRDVPLLPYLEDGDPWGLDLELEVRLNGHPISRPPYAGMYWTPAQMLAHLTVNGASVRSGDLYASGTVSGPARAQRGSLIELSWGGREPLVLPDGSKRSFLEDGDEVVISASAPDGAGGRFALGEVRGRIAPSV